MRDDTTFPQTAHRNKVRKGLARLAFSTRRGSRGRRTIHRGSHNLWEDEKCRELTPRQKPRLRSGQKATNMKINTRHNSRCTLPSGS